MIEGGSDNGCSQEFAINDWSPRLTAIFDALIANGIYYGTVSHLISPSFDTAHALGPGKTMGLAAFGEVHAGLDRLLCEHEDQVNAMHHDGCDDLRANFGLSDDYGREGVFTDVYVPPVANDSGQSPSGILADRPYERCTYPYLGRGFGEVDADPAVSVHLASDLLAGRIDAWYQGRSEVGPRALGHRNFLAVPYLVEIWRRLSEEVKGREPFRPVAATVLAEHQGLLIGAGQPSPHMTFSPRAGANVQEMAPAAVHANGTCRVQTLTCETNPVLYDAIALLHEERGVSLLINTSLNLAGEPIVDTPDNALRTYEHSRADVLHINGDRMVGVGVASSVS